MLPEAFRDDDKLRELPGKLADLAKQVADLREQLATVRPKLELALSDWHSLQGSLHTALQLFGALCVAGIIFFTVRTWRK